MARELGYVTTLWGRKRRLPEMQLEPYEFDFTNFVNTEFDPLNFNDSTKDNTTDMYNEYQIERINYYTNKLDKVWSRIEKEKIKQEAKQEGIIIKDNGGYIADAERQCVNARIQRKCSGHVEESNVTSW